MAALTFVLPESAILSISDSEREQNLPGISHNNTSQTNRNKFEGKKIPRVCPTSSI